MYICDICNFWLDQLACTKLQQSPFFGEDIFTRYKCDVCLHRNVSGNIQPYLLCRRLREVLQSFFLSSFLVLVSSISFDFSSFLFYFMYFSRRKAATLFHLDVFIFVYLILFFVFSVQIKMIFALVYLLVFAETIRNFFGSFSSYYFLLMKLKQTVKIKQRQQQTKKL